MLPVCSATLRDLLVCSCYSIQTLPFGYHFDPGLGPCHFSRGLRWLNLDVKFQRMDKAMLPGGLQSLTFGYFHQSLGNLQLPCGLQSLTCGFYFNRSLVSVVLSNVLQSSLTFGRSFNQSLDNATSPGSLRSLANVAYKSRQCDAAKRPAVTFCSTFNQS